jgi:hypothetical protein
MKSTKILFIILSFILTILISFYLGSQYQNINYSKEIEYFVSCKPYKEDFLQKMGFRDRNDCMQFNKELEDEYKNSCLEVIKKTDNTEFNETSLESCIYYSFSKARTSFDSNYYVFKHSKY